MIKLSMILLTFSNHTNKIKLTVKLDLMYYDMIFLYSSLIFISINNGPTNHRNTEIPPKHRNTPISWLFNSVFWQMHDRFVFFRVTLTQYAFIFMFIVSLKLQDRKINMPMTFVGKIYATENAHMFTEVPAAPCKICRFRLLCIFFTTDV